MNFLAHAFLSFKNPDILTGNMISDFVKGKAQYDYPDSIQKGIRLHRAIDTFTDNHESTAEIKEFFRPAYRLYSGPLTDIVYDYFLANDLTQFPNQRHLETFTSDTYNSLQRNITHMPATFRMMLPYMIKDNWLFNYRLETGILKSFNGMSRRAKYMTETSTAYSIFINNIDTIRPLYEQFFPVLKKYAADTLRDLLNND